MTEKIQRSKSPLEVSKKITEASQDGEDKVSKKNEEALFGFCKQTKNESQGQITETTNFTSLDADKLKKMNK